MKRKRKTKADVRAERDFEIAGFLDGYADHVEAGGTPANRLEHPEEIKGPLVVTLRGLASSIRAGLVE